MKDVLGKEVVPGDVLAISTRRGKHDSMIKILAVTEIGEAGRGGEYIRGYEGSGLRSQIQKENNLIVISDVLDVDHPRLELICSRMSDAELAALNERLSNRS